MIVDYKNSTGTFIRHKSGNLTQQGCCEYIKNYNGEYYDIKIPAYSAALKYNEVGTTLVKYINLIKNLGFDIEYLGLLTDTVKIEYTSYSQKRRGIYTNTLTDLSEKYNHKCDLVKKTENNRFLYKYLKKNIKTIKIVPNINSISTKYIVLQIPTYGRASVLIDGFKFSGSKLSIEDEIKSIYDYDKIKSLRDNFYTIRVYSKNMTPVSKLTALTLVRYFWKDTELVKNILRIKKEGISDFYSFMIAELYYKMSNYFKHGYYMIDGHKFTTVNNFKSKLKDKTTERIYHIFDQSLNKFSTESVEFKDKFKENKFKELETFLKNHN